MWGVAVSVLYCPGWAATQMWVLGVVRTQQATLHCPKDHAKRSYEQCDTCRPEKGGYSFLSIFETDAVFVSERLLFPFVSRKQDPLCHCTTHVEPKREPGAPQHPSSCQGRVTAKHTALHKAHTCPWASLKAFQEEFSKNAGCFLILASVQE